MKREHILILLWALWICSIILAVICVNRYIYNKRVELRAELEEKVENLFKGQSNGELGIDGNGLFFKDFSNKPVRNYEEDRMNLQFLQTSKPSERLAEMGYAITPNSRLDDEQEQAYGDLASLYVLNWGDDIPNNEDEGWSIIRICYYGTPEFLFESTRIFPYKVGFKNTKWGNPYTVERAVNEAFDYYTTNPNSYIADRYQNEQYRGFWSKLFDCSNKYYSIGQNHNLSTMGVSIHDYPFSKGMQYMQNTEMPFENGWVHNDYYRVFIATTRGAYWGIREDWSAVNEDRRNLILWWGIGLTLLFMLFIIPLTVLEQKLKNKKDETLYQRLCRLCNPKEFIQNYDKEKVDKANRIYQRLMATKPDDQDALMEIQEVAASELGVSIIDEEEIEDLKEKVNPKKYLNPYNAEKLALANELYSTLSKKGLTFKEFVEVMKESEKL